MSRRLCVLSACRSRILLYNVRNVQIYRSLTKIPQKSNNYFHIVHYLLSFAKIMEADQSVAKNRSNIVTDIPEFKVRAAYIDLNKPNQMQELIKNIGPGGFSTVPNPPEGFVDPYVSFLIFLTGLFFNVMWLFGPFYLKSSNPLARIPAIMSCVLGTVALLFYGTKWVFN